MPTQSLLGLHMRRRVQYAISPAIALFGLALATATALEAQPAAPQGAIAGNWVIRYERSVQNLHSTTPDAIQVVNGRLTLRQTGDSLFGEWQTLVAKGDTAPPPRKVHGVQRRDSVFVRFIPYVDTEASLVSSVAHNISEFFKEYFHGMPPTTTAIDVVMRGDTLTGIRRTVLLDGTPRGKGELLTGVRAKP